MIISFTTAFAIAAACLLAGMTLGAAALFTACRSLKRARGAGTAADIASLRISSLESALAGCAGQLETLLAERERERSAPTRPSLREAVALSRHGASAEELMATCSIGQSEARLIQMLYGTQRRAPDDGTACGMH